jgi:hypothetical protein
MKLGMNSQDLQDFILIKTWFNEKIMTSREGAGKANPKLGVKLLWGLI